MGKEKSCCLSHFMCGVECTVEPLYKGRHWDPADCPVYRGVPNSEVDLYTSLHTYVVGNADSVLIREVAFIQSVLYREVPLYMYIPHTHILYSSPLLPSPLCH